MTVELKAYLASLAISGLIGGWFIAWMSKRRTTYLDVLKAVALGLVPVLNFFFAIFSLGLLISLPLCAAISKFEDWAERSPTVARLRWPIRARRRRA